MKESRKCPNCGEEIELDFAPSMVRRNVWTYLSDAVHVAVFGVAGWALWEAGYSIWAVLCFGVGVSYPFVSRWLTMQQALAPLRAREARQKETERLVEIARQQEKN